MMTGVDSLESRVVRERDPAEERMVHGGSSHPRRGFELPLERVGSRLKPHDRPQASIPTPASSDRVFVMAGQSHLEKGPRQPVTKPPRY